MFSSLDSHTHAQRKRLMSSDFSKSNIMASAALRDNAHKIIFARLLPAINASSAQTGLPINIHEMYKAAAIDFVTAFLFGLPSASTLLTNPHKRARIFHMYATKKSASWTEKLPFNFACLPAPLRSMLMPREAIKANEEIERFCLEMCSAADKAADANHSPADTSNVYQRMKAGLLVGKHMDSGLLEVSPLQQQSTFASEMLDHISASAGILLNIISDLLTPASCGTSNLSCLPELSHLRAFPPSRSTQKAPTGALDARAHDLPPKTLLNSQLAS